MPDRPSRRHLPPLAWFPLLAQAFVALALTGCLTGPPRPGSVASSARLDAFPTRLATRAGAEICFDEHAIPIILATDDLDVPYLMGVTHAHLRLTQMEITRRLSQGRLSELAGPPVNGIDHSIRALDLARAVPEMEERLPDETRAWIQRYVDGVNDHRERVDARPADYRLAGIGEEPWTIADVLTIGRLACVDINWGRWVSLFPLRDEMGWEEYMGRLHAFGAAARPSFGSGEPTSLDAIMDAGRTGSNCVVVAPERSATGGALLAGDPHLGLPQPNLWCIVGYRSPSHAAVGLTFPGLPFILVGRNEHIAWGGTNMHAPASVLYRLPDDEPLRERRERIETRLFFDPTVTVRQSRLGPVITDAPLFEKLADGPAAMRWRGHAPSDESTAFLKASHARGWEEFRAAFRTFAAGGQNMLYADEKGNIGHVVAFEFQPAAGMAAAADGPVDPADPRFQWGEGIDSTRLPAAFNPPEGFLVSANNTPVLTEPALLAHGNANDRILRLREVLEANPSVTPEDLATLQRDVYAISSHAAARAMVETLGAEVVAGSPLLTALRDWEGHYTIDSTGAVAYQRVLDALLEPAYGGRYGAGLMGRLRSAAYVHDFVREDLESGRIARDVLVAAAAAAGEGYDAGQTWGDLHRLQLDHAIGRVPILGRGYRFGEIPSPGSLTTIQKAGHRVTSSVHEVTYGQNARHISDLSDVDANQFVILGGQDGWLGSEHFLDQVDLWREGGMIRVPLREASVRGWAERTIVIRSEGE